MPVYKGGAVTWHIESTAPVGVELLMPWLALRKRNLRVCWLCPCDEPLDSAYRFDDQGQCKHEGRKHRSADASSREVTETTPPCVLAVGAR